MEDVKTGSDDERTPLRRPEEIKEPPSVALHLLTKNAESVIERLLSNVGPYVSEIVAAVNDTTDDTIKILESWGKQQGKRVDLTLVTSESHPHLYIRDARETYEAGRSLCGESFSDDLFTGQPILADWATVRNLAWERCTAKWKLFLDSDDVVRDPHAIWGLCELLDENAADLALTKYSWSIDEEGRPKGASYRERISRSSPDIRWIYPIHEVLHGYEKQAFVDGNLHVVDMRDSRGAGIRIPGRNFKILYHLARTNDWEISSRVLLQLAEAGKSMPEFVQRAIDIYLDRSTWPEERCWAYCLKGESFEAQDKYSWATECYEKALIEHPGTKAAFRLCRSRYYQQEWKGTIDAYHLGLQNMQALQVLDDGPLYADSSKILVADAMWRLGRRGEAAAMAEVALKAFPTNSALMQMHKDIAAGKPPPPFASEARDVKEGLL